MAAAILQMGCAFALTLAIAGCDSAEPRRSVDAGAGEDASAPGDSGIDGDGGKPERAILSRPSRDTYVCVVTQPRTDYAPLNWGSAGHALTATSGGKAFLARVEFDGDEYGSPTPPDKRFVVSPLGLDGKFGTATAVSAKAELSGSPAVTPLGDGFALAWTEAAALGMDGTLRFAAFDAAGAPVGTSKALPIADTTYVFRGATQLARSGSHFGLVYRTPGTYRFSVFDAEGAVVAQPRDLVPGGGATVTAVSIQSTATGFAAAWVETAASGSRLLLTFLDEEGATRIAPQVLASSDDLTFTSSYFDRPSVALVDTGAGLVAAWIQSRFVSRTNSTEGGYAYIRVAKLDGDGHLVAPPVTLRDVVDSVDEVEPMLLRFGDAVAVLWSHGSHIYGCGGCMPDHRIDMVLLAPDTLDPLSNVVSIQKRTDAAGGGLVYKDAVVIDDSVLLTFDQQYHTTSDPGSAAISCAKR